MTSTDTIGPEDFPPGYSAVQLPIDNQNFWPYKDLGLEGGYGRKLYLPDDLLPTLSLGWGLNANGPRTFQMRDDGALIVWNENTSPAGGTTTPMNLGSAFDFASTNGNTTKQVIRSVNPAGVLCHGFSWIVTGDGTVTGHEGAMLQITAGATGTIYLDWFAVYAAYPAGICHTQAVTFPRPIDLGAFFGPFISSVDVAVTDAINNGNVSGVVYLSSS